MKIVTYSAITGGKDAPRNDVLCFGGYDRFNSNRLNAKIYKVLPHLFFDCDYSIWIDGNIKLKMTDVELVEYLGDKDIAVLEHDERTRIQDEAEVVKRFKLDDPDVVDEHIERILKTGYKDDKGLGFCGMIIRKHTDKIARLNEKWWAEITTGSSRDQISFPYVYQDEVNYIPREYQENNQYYHRAGHLN